MKLSTGAWVVACDGQKYLLLENRGDEAVINLQTIAHESLDPAELDDTGVERPGRFPAPGPRRGTGEMDNLHDLAERRFLSGLASKLEQWEKAGRFRELVVIADKTSLGTLRQVLPQKVSGRIVGEFASDVVHDTTPHIEAFIKRA